MSRTYALVATMVVGVGLGGRRTPRRRQSLQSRSRRSHRHLPRHHVRHNRQHRKLRSSPISPTSSNLGSPGETARRSFASARTTRSRKATPRKMSSIIGGNATIAGETQDLVIIAGTGRLMSTAVVTGDAVVVGGRMSVEPGATVTGDLVIVGGGLDSPGDFLPGGEQVVIGSAILDSGVATMVPWVTRGLFFGRPIVPSLPWVWGFVLVALLVYMAVSVIFQTPVSATTRALADAPLTAFLAGLIVLLATGPVVLLLAVSVVGLAVIPFALCALFLAALVGRIGAVRWLGRSVLAEDDPSSRAQTLRSLAIGAVILSLVYMVPVLGMVTWASIGVMGLGAAAMACAAGLRRENPKRPTPPVSPIPPSPAPADGFVGAPAMPPPVDASPCRGDRHAAAVRGRRPVRAGCAVRGRCADWRLARRRPGWHDRPHAHAARNVHAAPGRARARRGCWWQ